MNSAALNQMNMKISYVTIATCETSGEDVNYLISYGNSYKYLKKDKIRIIFYTPDVSESKMNLYI